MGARTAKSGPHPFPEGPVNECQAQGNLARLVEAKMPAVDLYLRSDCLDSMPRDTREHVKQTCFESTDIAMFKMIALALVDARHLSVI